jgi:hypothetical protein
MRCRWNDEEQSSTTSTGSNTPTWRDPETFLQLGEAPNRLITHWARAVRVVIQNDSLAAHHEGAQFGEVSVLLCSRLPAGRRSAQAKAVVWIKEDEITLSCRG